MSIHIHVTASFFSLCFISLSVHCNLLSWFNWFNNFLIDIVNSKIILKIKALPYLKNVNILKLYVVINIVEFHFQNNMKIIFILADCRFSN